MYPVITFGTVIERSNGLEALSEAEHERKKEECNPVGNAHSGDSGIPVACSHDVKSYGCHASKPLSCKCRKPSENHVPVVYRLERDKTH